MTKAPVIGLLHPGEMGAAVGNCLVRQGLRVLWAADGRGTETTERARAAGLADVGTAAAVAEQADVIISVCPPHAALDVATSVRGFSGRYLDANAIAPATAREVGALVGAAGARYVDGGIIGPPPLSAGSTRLYLSGPDAEPVRELFDGSVLDARLVPGDLCGASAVKMAYAAWTKGSAALLLTARALAEALDVSDVLTAEWALSVPGLDDRLQGAARSAGAKGWRWIGEMEQIAATMAQAGLPAGFHQAAAEVFRRSAQAADGDPVDRILTALIAAPPPGAGEDS
jgi:3-hydroxyisobutyrate dehydrogenase-like beta-hydroxyacid dehydrogenase